ncbi:MAG TPA: bifunctional precorrin-2 dehydrogenase/sirohydrochlorin ferrochelatase [Thermoanaerobaculia bacterium]|nr:bifunctional precorrin-2 dehydrogenase/sirohydrochlorin ferrochelatase [Thermoanaerobaculia bacterium]
MAFYPVFLDLRGRKCLVVGSGPLAEEKVAGLLEAGAAVTVVSPAPSPKIADLAAHERIVYKPRTFEPADLDGAALAIAAGQDPATAEAIWRESEKRGILLNTVDDVPHCNFIAPSIVRRGDLAVAISTGGKAPALAVRLRQHIETLIGDEHARFLDLAGTVRTRLAQQVPDFGTRRDRWYRLVDSDVLALLREGDHETAHRRFEEILGVAP